MNSKTLTLIFQIPTTLQTKQILMMPLMPLNVTTTTILMTKQQRNLRAQQQGPGGRGGHEESCLPQALPQAPVGLGVQGALEVPDDQACREHHCGHLVQPRPQGREIRRHRGYLGDP